MNWKWMLPSVARQRKRIRKYVSIMKETEAASQIKIAERKSSERQVELIFLGIFVCRISLAYRTPNVLKYGSTR